MGDPYNGARIVCAANKYPSGRLVLGARHFDLMMQDQMERLPESDREDDPEQGFIDQRGKFYDRREAWALAAWNGQIIRRVGGDSLAGHGLFSENLY